MVRRACLIRGSAQADPRWKAGNIAFVEATLKADPTRHGDLWWRGIGAPITDTYAMLWEAVLDSRPNQFSVELKSLREEGDDA